MNKIYAGQNSLRIRALLELEEDENMVGATPVLIKYKKPDGTISSWTATVEDAYEGIIYYDVVLISELADTGKWTLWGHVTFSDGRVAAGEPYIMEVLPEGTVS